MSSTNSKEVRVAPGGGTLLALALSFASSAGAQDVARPGLPPLAESYHRPAGMQNLALRWAEAYGDGLRVHLLGEGEVETPLVALEFGQLQEGAAALEARPTVFLLGGSDGRSLAGSEAVLHASRSLLGAGEALGTEICVIAVPFAAPEALERCLEGGPGAAQPAGQDLDGDGLVLEMLREDPAGPWTRARDPRFLLPALPGEQPRFLRFVEGGQETERALGLDGHFPIHWEPTRGAPAPLTDPAQRALATLMLERPTCLVLSFAGTHGGLLRPASPDAAEDPRYYDLARAFAASRGEHQVRLAASQAGGRLLDWVETVVEAPAVELSVWGPPCEVPDPAAEVDGPWRARRAATADDRAWGRWLDQERAGLGFVEWRRVELGGGERALVGGWMPRTRFNPPEEELQAALAGVPAFVGAVLQELPRLELAVLESERDGEMVYLRARVSAAGELPPWMGTRVPSIRLEAPVGVELLAGPRERDLPGLHPGGQGTLLEWQLLVPEGAALTLTYGGPFSATRRREVRP